MVKHTQKIRRLLPTNCVSVFDHFVELALKRFRALLSFLLNTDKKNYLSKKPSMIICDTDKFPVTFLDTGIMLHFDTKKGFQNMVLDDK